MVDGIRVTDAPSLASADDFLTIKDGTAGRLSAAALSTAISATGAVADRLNAVEQATGYAIVLQDTWAALALLTPTAIGQGAEVPDSDTGTHTDPSTSLTVDNAGRYTAFGTGVGEWKWIAETGLSAKVDKAAGAVEGSYLKTNYRASSTALSRLAPGLRRAQPERLFDFELGGFAEIDDYGDLAPASFSDIATCTRASTADYTDQNSDGQTAAINEPLLNDWSTGARGLLVLPTDGGSRAGDVIRTITYAEQIGSVWIDFYYDPAQANGQNRGLFSVDGDAAGTGSEFKGVSLFFRSADDLPTIFVDDGTHDGTTAWSHGALTEGRYQAQLTWDLTTGEASLTIGDDSISVGPVGSWLSFAPAKTQLGNQDVTGVAPRQFNGTIYRVATLPAGAAVDLTPAGTDAAAREDVPDLVADDISTAATSALAVDLRRAQLNGIVPRLGADFATSGYAYQNSDGSVSPYTFGTLITFARASTAAYIDRDGASQEAAINVPAFDYSEGGRGLMALPSDGGSRAADQISMPIVPQKGAALVEFYPPDVSSGTGYRGIVSISAGFGVGFSAMVNAATGKLFLHMDDGTEDYTDNRVDLGEGLNGLLVAWDLSTGECAFSLNGGPIINLAPKDFVWSPVVPTTFVVGDQDTIGGEPRQFNGNIVSIYVYDQAAKAPISKYGPLEKAIRKATRNEGMPLLENGSEQPIGANYVETVIANARCLQVLDETIGHVRITATSNDYGEAGDSAASKVRSELKRRIGFAPDATIYFHMEMMVPNKAFPGWAVLTQFHQPATTGYPGEPVLTIQVSEATGDFVLVRNTQSPVVPTDPVYEELAVLPITEGEWADIDIYAEFSNGVLNGGVLKCRVNGIEVYSNSAITLGYTNPALIASKIGVYREESEVSDAAFSVEYRNWMVDTDPWPGAYS